jgi:hypothetical protein
MKFNNKRKFSRVKKKIILMKNIKINYILHFKQQKKEEMKIK